MATLANIFSRFTAVGAIATEEAVSHTRGMSDAFRLRSLPNEEVYFYSKRIDNSRVVRQPDPTANSKGIRVFGGASLVATLVIAILLPSAYSLMAGFKLNETKRENEQLLGEQSRLSLEYAQLTRTEHLQKLAKAAVLASPRPDQIVYVPPKSDSSLALNRTN